MKDITRSLNCHVMIMEMWHCIARYGLKSHVW